MNPTRTFLFAVCAVLIASCEKEIEEVKGPELSTDGLILHMPFSGNANDSSTNASNGQSFGNLSYGRNRYFEPGKAVEFNGINSRIEIPAQKFEGLSTFTMYMEFMPYTASEMVLFSKTFFNIPPSGVMQQSFNVIINHQQGGTRFNMKKSGRCDDHNTNTAFGAATYGSVFPMADCWNYIAVTFDKNNIKIYLNGDLVGQGTEAGASICGGASPMQVGAWWTGYGNYFRGKIDELRMYNKVLTEGEIKALYKLN